MSIRFVLAALALFVTISSAALAQSSDPSSFTLHTQARVVLTDVTVVDATGNPVRNLDRSAFHIFDNKKPQGIASLEEHTGAQPAAQIPAASSAGPHTFSNDFLLHPPPVFNVIVLDTATIDIVDQMYLNQQLTEVINSLPAETPLAIFVHNGEFALLLQNFTSDHTLLLAAIHKAIPVLEMPGSKTYNSFQAMQQIAIYLGQLPGRKNVLWYSSGSNLFLRADASRIPSYLDPKALRLVYDQLEANRIALYPVNASGIGARTEVKMQMDDEAKATGGHAYFENDIGRFSSKTIASDANFYTLSYSPRDFKQDNKWHNVKVTVDGGPYTLSYRTGYYGDGIYSQDPAETKRARTLLTSNGEKVQRPENYNQPIIFRADVQPSSSISVSKDPTALSEKKNETIYDIHYTVPAADFVQDSIPGGQRVQIGAGVLAFNEFGRSVGRRSQKFVLGFNGDKLTKTPNAKISFDQQVSLPKGQDYLVVAVWDIASGRLGTLQVPLNVAKRVSPAHLKPGS